LVRKLFEVGVGRLACAALKLDASRTRTIRAMVEIVVSFILVTL